MTELKIKADKRKVFGRKIKKLRTEGLLPSNVYGKKLKSQALTVDLKEFLSIYKQVGETGIVYLGIKGEDKARPVLIHNLQKDPTTDCLLHADFRQIDLKQKVQVRIPIELIGEAPAATKGGVLVQVMNEVEVEALPTDLVDKIEVDISKLEEIGQSINVKGLKINTSKIKILVDNPEQVVVQVEQPKEEKEEVKPAEEVAPVEGEEKPAEGEEKVAEAGPKPETKPEAGKPQEKKEEKK